MREGDRRTRWDERYSEGDWVDVRGPTPLLLDAQEWLPSGGTAFDAACGAGRNALWLARRGWRVVGVDLSIEGLRLLRARMRPGQDRIQPVLADLAHPPLAPRSLDLAVNSFFLLRPLLPALIDGLRPGGLLLFETYSVLELEALGGDIRREFTVERGELLEFAAGLEILLHEEGIFEREEGERGLARLIARKR